MHCESFAPLIAARPVLLILGSMPGVASLRAAQYYAHPRNAFWPILFDYFTEPHSTDYEARCGLILHHSLALWDAANSCERSGSLDSDIQAVVPNDIDQLLAAHPSISGILCNGQKAYQLLRRYGMGEGVPAFVLPSTSPAHASRSYEAKRNMWHTALRRWIAPEPVI